jgi:plasmid stabilization system protein ParE
MWRVRGFEAYLIFYYPQQDGIAVERVIHASQDYRRVLG